MSGKKTTKHANNIRSKQLKANSLGAIGYMASILSYLALGIVLFQLLSKTSIMTVEPHDIAQSNGSTAIHGVLGLAPSLLSYGITAIVFIVTLIVLMTFPYFLARYYARGLRLLMKSCRIALSLRNLYYAKALAAVLPLVGFMITTAVNPLFDMSYPYFYMTSVALVALALLFFWLQFLVVKYTKLAVRYVW